MSVSVIGSKDVVPRVRCEWLSCDIVNGRLPFATVLGNLAVVQVAGAVTQGISNSWTTDVLTGRSEKIIYSQTNSSNMSIEEAITAILILSAGVTMIAYSIRPYRKMRVIKNSDEVSISAAISRGDMVQIGGKVLTLENTISSPIENRDCVGYEYEISESVRDFADMENDHYWNELEKEQEAVDFILEDHTGAARIHVNGADLSLTCDSIYTTSDPYAAPTTVTGDPITFDPKEFNFEDRLRFKEGTVQAGDWISVIGLFTNRKTHNSEADEITSDEILYIFDEDTEDKVKSLKKRAVNTFIFGIIFTSFSVAFITLELLQ